MKAPDYLQKALDEMMDRASQRDTPDGERSMAATVEAFWTIYGDSISRDGVMTETQGWQFMVLLKMVRGANGDYREDDYVDEVAYAALAAESASK